MVSLAWQEWSQTDNRLQVPVGMPGAEHQVRQVQFQHLDGEPEACVLKGDDGALVGLAGEAGNERACML
eukprot:8013162-Prorocentrum_lima.AAC.1